VTTIPESGAVGDSTGRLGVRIGNPPTGAAAPGTVPLDLGGARDGVLHVPASAAAEEFAPLLVVLHGAGGGGARMVDLLRDRADEHGVLLLAPDSRLSTWDVIARRGYGEDVRFLRRALHRVLERHAVEPARTAVAGFSDGASYALCLGLANGDLFHHVLAWSPGFAAPAARVGTPRVFVSHGTRDRVLPVDRCSRRLVPALRAQGYDVDYLEFPGGHEMPGDVLDASLHRFLTSPLTPGNGDLPD
jgi:phospholipase/carboxylesterase